MLQLPCMYTENAIFQLLCTRGDFPRFRLRYKSSIQLLICGDEELIVKRQTVLNQILSILHYILSSSLCIFILLFVYPIVMNKTGFDKKYQKIIFPLPCEKKNRIEIHVLSNKNNQFINSICKIFIEYFQSMRDLYIQPPPLGILYKQNFTPQLNLGLLTTQQGSNTFKSVCAGFEAAQRQKQIRLTEHSARCRYLPRLLRRRTWL